jgi:3-deoxy-manno-octulosonate cytidylyltransferase (CMP-KDO synthetase)
MQILAVIPARYASTRFPGKPLAEIAGKPMVRHVYERCRSALGVSRVIVATEDDRIVHACKAFGGEAELTSPEHVSGTDRVAEVAARHPEFDGILNVQGDEPGIEPETVQAVALLLSNPDVQIASAMTRFLKHEPVGNPNAVKVVTDARGDALYFSRAPIPYFRDPTAQNPMHFRHLGIYGFSREVLLKLTKLAPSQLERAESLEQLRWLEAGYRLRLVEVQSRSAGIDTPADLDLYVKTSATDKSSIIP